jgi:hypothetical protein
VVEQPAIGARDVCERCSAYLHCCLNCAFYTPGAHNDCHEPAVELVADKEQGNFCDYFRIASEIQKAPSRQEDPRARLEALFRKK